MGEGLLAAAGFTLEQYAGVVGGDLEHLLAQPLQGVTASDRFRHHRQLLLEVDHLAGELVGLQGALDHQQQPGQRDGLFDEVVGAQAGGLDRGLDRTVAGDDDDRAGQFAAFGPFAQQRDAVDVLHPDIEQDQIGTMGATLAPGAAAAVGDADVVPFLFQNLLDQGADIRFIVDDQDMG